jgi:hypothetical protein
MSSVAFLTKYEELDAFAGRVTAERPLQGVGRGNGLARNGDQHVTRDGLGADLQAKGRSRALRLDPSDPQAAHDTSVRADPVDAEPRRLWRRLRW